jgi:hypothetical protein
MTVIARDAVASDHLVYAWPFPIGPECEVACADDEQVVMCPAWLVGDRLGPGRHVWRTPDPTRPVSAFFVLTAPVEVSFDMTTMFIIPSTGQPVRVRASGSLQVRCSDPGLLIAQFVGLPFDRVNDGILRSISRSVERMLARLLTRRVVMAGSPYAVTDLSMLPGIVEELVAYNPTAGAVFGVDLIRMGHLTIVADDGSSPYILLPESDWSDGHPRHTPPNGDYRNHVVHTTQLPPHLQRDDISLVETARGRPGSEPSPHPSTPQGVTPYQTPHGISPYQTPHGISPYQTPHGISPYQTPHGIPPYPATPHGTPHATPHPITPHGTPNPLTQSSPEIAPPPAPTTTSGEIRSGEIRVRPGSQPDPPRLPPPPLPPVPPVPRRAHGAHSTEDITQPGVNTPVPGMMRIGVRADATPIEERGAIHSVGVSPIGYSPAASSVVSGEIGPKVAPGSRVLVPGPNGLMQSATVRQLLQGYYELEVGSSGETIWVPISGVVPEQ